MPEPNNPATTTGQKLYLWLYNVIHAIAANWSKLQFNLPSPTKFTGIMLCLVILTISTAPALAAEDSLPNQVIGGGFAYDQYVDKTPMQFWCIYAKRISGPLYSFSSFDVSGLNSYDALGNLVLPTLQYSPRTGVAIHVTDFGNITVFLLGEAGIAASAVATTSAFGAGGLAAYRFKNGWGAIAAVRILKDAAGGRRYVPEFGICYGVK